jgi:alkylation response protein AidB-like acyl-CoA dehydrogenase
MPAYNPPLRDLRFVLFDLLKLDTELKAMPRHAAVDADTIHQVLEEAGKFASQVAFPINQSGDREGCTFHGNSVVTTPKGFKEAYKKYTEAGWPGLAAHVEFGGQGLPNSVNGVLHEMLNSANQAWAMYPGLSMGAYECLHANASEELQHIYLPKLASGEWTGTMCLTEPHCGTDLGLMRSTATDNGDGSWSITGTKIFISSGEHDVAPNIVHLVLARLPDAPMGTKGISLFVVPKFLPGGADGKLGARNGINCGAIEHKMGIHGNSTCVMNLDGARGWLVGPPNAGLAGMFVMMNLARLAVGRQSLGLSEVAYQNSLTYARERLQSRSLSGPKAKDKPADPIIVHPDVRRMLLTQKAYTEGARAFVCWLALLVDRETDHPDAAVRKEALDLLSLFTPVAKAFITDNGLECTNLAMQVLGGHGFITEWGMEQYVRDARINLIYEGTNGIQALDLLGRKVLADGGARLEVFQKVVTGFVKEHAGNPAMAEFVGPLLELGKQVAAVTADIGARARKDPEEVGAASTPYLRLMGHLVFTYLWGRMAAVALKNPEDPFNASKLATARFYLARLLPETRTHLETIRSGAAPLMQLDAALF